MSEAIKNFYEELIEYSNGGMSGLYPPEEIVKDFVIYIKQLQQENQNTYESSQDMLEEMQQKLDEIKNITLEQLEYCQNEFNEWWINQKYKHGYDEWSVAIQCLSAIRDRL